MMMSLGLFVFSLPTLAYQDLQQRFSWRHAENGRVGARPASQFTGPDADKITLSGVLFPEVAGKPASLEELRAMGETGQAWPLVDGLGTVLGAYVIESLDLSASHFFQDGVPRKTDFTIGLKSVDDPAPAQGGFS